GLGSASRGSMEAASASAGRGRGNGLTLAGLPCGIWTTEPNIGAGCGPCCRNSALAMMALAAAKASRPAIMSFGLCKRMRIARPRSFCSIAAAAEPRRRRGNSSSATAFLGTFLHLNGLLLKYRIMGRSRNGRQRRDLVLRLGRSGPRENKRQRHRDSGAFVDLALHGYFAGMEADQAFHDGKPEPGALMTALIGFAGLEKGIADPLQVIGGDADAGVGDAQHQPRSLGMGGRGHPAPTLGELDRVGDEIEHDLLERTRITGHDRQILRNVSDEVDAAFTRF